MRMPARSCLGAGREPISGDRYYLAPADKLSPPANRVSKLRLNAAAASPLSITTRSFSSRLKARRPPAYPSNRLLDRHPFDEIDFLEVEISRTCVKFSHTHYVGHWRSICLDQLIRHAIGCRNNA